MKDIPEITTKTYAHKGFFDLRIDTLKKNHQSENYTVLLTKAKSVAVLGREVCGRYLIIKEYRYPVGKWVYSLPGGRVEKQELLEHAAKRELFEETGFVANNLRPLFTHLPFPSVADQSTHVFFTKECEEKSRPKLDPLEVIKPLLLKEKELIQLLQQRSSEVDSLLSSALFYLLVSETYG